MCRRRGALEKARARCTWDAFHVIAVQHFAVMLVDNARYDGTSLKTLRISAAAQQQRATGMLY